LLGSAAQVMGSVVQVADWQQSMVRALFTIATSSKASYWSKDSVLLMSIDPTYVTIIIKLNS